MNSTELSMYNFLKDLKENHHIIGIKISYEDEGLTGELAQIISSIAFKAGVSVSVKIGGCEAKRDMHDAKVLGADKIVAPMVETAYAMKKFIEATHSVYSDDERQNTKFMVNVETITGYKNLREMMALPEINELFGFTLGRVDFSGSMGKDRSFVNSEEMQSMALDMAKIAQENNKKFFLGGGVSAASLEFFRKLPQDVFYSFETRNIIFDAQYSLKDPNIEEALTKAMGFELAWMKRKKEFFGYQANSETKRIEMITERYNNSVAALQKSKIA